MVKIISGLAQGMALKIPAGQTTRPTGAKLRESVLNSLHLSLEGTTFVDFCAGSGAIGFEALSRGAAACYFVENDRAAFQCLQANWTEFQRRMEAQELKAPRVGLLFQSVNDDFTTKIPEHSVDFLWVDPPYERMAVIDATFVQRLRKIAAPTAQLLIEADKNFDISTLPLEKSWELQRERKMGASKILTFSPIVL